MKHWFILVSCILLSVVSAGQTAGTQVYNFLQNANSPRSATLGGRAILHREGSSSVGIDNPANLDTNAAGSIGLNASHFGQSEKSGNAVYAHRIGTKGVGFGGIQFVGYGTLTATDETGQTTGEFSVGEYAAYVGYSHPLTSRLTFGGSLVNVFGNYAGNNSYGLGLNAGLHYTAENERTSLALVMRNMGYQLTTYQDVKRRALPFDPQVGFSHKLSKAPFRLLVIAHTLHQWQVSYDNPFRPPAVKEDPLTGETTERVLTLDKVARHLIFGVDLVPNEKFYLTLSYNYAKAAEMKVGERSGLVGMSLGAGLRIKRFMVGYTLSSNHFVTNTHSFGLSTNLSRF